MGTIIIFNYYNILPLHDWALEFQLQLNYFSFNNNYKFTFVNYNYFLFSARYEINSRRHAISF